MKVIEKMENVLGKENVIIKNKKITQKVQELNCEEFHTDGRRIVFETDGTYNVENATFRIAFFAKKNKQGMWRITSNM